MRKLPTLPLSPFYYLVSPADLYELVQPPHSPWPLQSTNIATKTAAATTHIVMANTGVPMTKEQRIILTSGTRQVIPCHNFEV
jgi:hypothetical protein